MTTPKTLFDEIGGRFPIERVHTLLYDKLLMHPWLKGFFVDNERWHLEEQQTEFMMRLFHGPNIYQGRMPRYAHEHMFITEEIFMIRHEILKDCLIEYGVREDLRVRWLACDMTMKRALVKKDISECKPRYYDSPILQVKKP